MQRMHIHTPEWVRHIHKPHWHGIGLHLEQLIHSPRFWAGIALATLLGLMILTMILSKSEGRPVQRPYYPFMP